MQPLGQRGDFARPNHPAMMHPSYSPYMIYALNRDTQLQGPLPFIQYIKTANITITRASVISYIKLCLNHFLAQHTVGDIAIAGYTGLACRLEKTITTEDVETLRKENSTLNEIFKKNSLELYSMNANMHAQNMTTFLNLVFLNIPEFNIQCHRMPSQMTDHDQSQNIVFTLFTEFLTDIQILDTTKSQQDHLFNFPHQQDLLISCSLQDYHNQEHLFWLPVVTTSKIITKISFQLSQKHYIKPIREHCIEMLNFLANLNQFRAGYCLLNSAEIEMIQTLIYCVEHPDNLTESALTCLQQHGLVLATETYRLVRCIGTMTPTYNVSDQATQPGISDREALTLRKCKEAGVQVGKIDTSEQKTQVNLPRSSEVVSTQTPKKVTSHKPTQTLTEEIDTSEQETQVSLPRNGAKVSTQTPKKSTSGKRTQTMADKIKTYEQGMQVCLPKSCAVVSTQTESFSTQPATCDVETMTTETGLFETVLSVRIGNIKISTSTEAKTVETKATEQASGIQPEEVEYLDTTDEVETEPASVTFPDWVPAKLKDVFKQQHDVTRKLTEIVRGNHEKLDEEKSHLFLLNHLIILLERGDIETKKKHITDLNIDNRLKKITSCTKELIIIFCHIPAKPHTAPELLPLILNVFEIILKTRAYTMDLLKHMQERLSRTSEKETRDLQCQQIAAAYSGLLDMTALLAIGRELLSGSPNEGHQERIEKLIVAMPETEVTLKLYQDIFNWLSNLQQFKMLDVQACCHALSETLTKHELAFWRHIRIKEHEIFSFAELINKMITGYYMLGCYVTALDFITYHTRKMMEHDTYHLKVTTDKACRPTQEIIVAICENTREELNQTYRKISSRQRKVSEQADSVAYLKSAETYILFSTILMVENNKPNFPEWLDINIRERLDKDIRTQYLEINQKSTEEKTEKLREMIAFLERQTINNKAYITTLRVCYQNSSYYREEKIFDELTQTITTLQNVENILEQLNPNRTLSESRLRKLILDMYIKLGSLTTTSFQILSLTQLLQCAAEATAEKEREIATTDMIELLLHIHELQKTITNILLICKNKTTHKSEDEQTHIQTLERTTVATLLLDTDTISLLLNANKQLLEKYAHRLEPLCIQYITETCDLYELTYGLRCNNPDRFYKIHLLLNRAGLRDLAMIAMTQHVNFLSTNEKFRTDCLQKQGEGLVPTRKLLIDIYESLVESYRLEAYSDSPQPALMTDNESIDDSCQFLQVLLDFANSIDKLSKLDPPVFLGDYTGIVTTEEIQMYSEHLEAATHLIDQMTLCQFDFMD